MGVRRSLLLQLTGVGCLGLAIHRSDLSLGLVAFAAFVAAASLPGTTVGRAIAPPLMIIGAAFFPSLEPLARVALAAVGLHASLAFRLGLARTKPVRMAMQLSGHVILGAGSAVALVNASPAQAMLAWSVGLALLGASVLWADRIAPGHTLREAALLGTGFVSIAVAFLHGSLGGRSPQIEALAQVALATQAVVLAFAISPATPARAGPRPAGDATMLVLQGAFVIALCNAGVLLLASYSVSAARVIFFLLTLFVAATVCLEYRLLAAAARRRAPENVGPLTEPLTIVVAALDDAETLERAMAQNIRLPELARFILVPSVASKDSTVKAARRIAARSRGRVRVILGTSGSKAGDLNEAWRHVETDAVLILDADETIDEGSLVRGLARLRRSPDIGVVQGRKLSRQSDDGMLGRFVNAERRHSTGFDQAFQAESMGAAHFAGSGALLRREVGLALGWTDATLTEDIEFTLRLYLDGRWHIDFEPHMLVRESDPATFSGLLRQRIRWARGWMQCTRRYAPVVWARRAELGRARTMGLLWLMFTAVSAPLATLLPAALAMNVLGVGTILPVVVTLPLAILVLPARLIGYTYAGVRDPHIPLRRTPARFVELVVHAYLWIPLSWALQLRALCLECAGAARVWQVTQRKRLPARRVAGGAG